MRDNILKFYIKIIIPNQLKIVYIIFILLYISILFQPIYLSSISMSIKGPGNQKIIDIENGNFKYTPNEIYINGILQNYQDIYVYNLNDEIYNIIINWSEDIFVTSTYRMFYNLNNLISIDILDFNYPSLTDTRNMFEGCSNLETVNSYNMDTSNVEDMSDMFNGCSKLTWLNLNSFKISKVENMWNTFINCQSLRYFNMNNFETKYNLQINWLLTDFNSNIKVCYDQNKAAKISQIFPSNYNDCSSVCYKNNYFYCYNLNQCPTEYKNLILERKICIDRCENDNIYQYKYEYNNRCIKNCPIRTRNENNICIDLNCQNYYSLNQDYCLDSLPEGYYLRDQILKTIDLCDSNCKTCIETSTKCLSCNEYFYLDNFNNRCEQCQANCKKCTNVDNCNLCDENFVLINDYPVTKKCFIKCEFYHYFNENGDYYCTQSERCPDNFAKLINNKRRCIDNCNKDDTYKYEYENECFNECPPNTKNLGNICELDIYEILSEFENNDDRMVYLSNYLEQIDARKIIEKQKEGEDIIYEFNEMTIQITSTFNQKENVYQNISIIDLKDCEQMLKDAYNISQNESLIIYKVDILKQNMKIPRIEYQVYYPLNKDKLEILNLTKCGDKQIDILQQYSINEDEIDKYNIKSDYYKDICYKAKSANNTDITMEDRKNYYLDNNLNICEENCDYVKIEKDINKVKCACDINTKLKVFSEVNINKNKLLKGFIDIHNIMNLNVMKCFNALLNKSQLYKNYSNLIFYPVITFHFILFILYLTKEKKKFKLIINRVLYQRNANKNKLNKIKKTKNIKNKNIQNICPFFNRIFSKNRKLKNKPNYKANKCIILNKMKIINKKHLFNKNKSRLVLKTRNNIVTKNNIKSKCLIKKKYNMSYKPIKLTINELNELSYKKALRFDKRSYFIYYISLLKVKHIILFSFLPINDYNLQTVKIDLFLFSFILSLTTNALFFNDKTMHRIYIDQGIYNLIYQIYQIIYSALISAVINNVIFFLALTEQKIIKLKLINNLKLKKKKLKIIFCTNIAYFVVTLIFLLLFLYYLGCFCSVYENTQIHLIIDTSISFGIGLIYPIFIQLIPGIFRIWALKKKNMRLLYKFSQFLQYL